MLGQLIGTDVFGHLLDAIGDADLRDLVLKVLARAKGIADDDEAEARRLAGTIVPSVCVSPSRSGA